VASWRFCILRAPIRVTNLTSISDDACFQPPAGWLGLNFGTPYGLACFPQRANEPIIPVSRLAVAPLNATILNAMLADADSPACLILARIEFRASDSYLR
jgi:hypothetical protein